MGKRSHSNVTRIAPTGFHFELQSHKDSDRFATPKAIRIDLRHIRIGVSKTSAYSLQLHAHAYLQDMRHFFVFFLGGGLLLVLGFKMSFSRNPIVLWVHACPLGQKGINNIFANTACLPQKAVQVQNETLKVSSPKLGPSR